MRGIRILQQTIETAKAVAATVSLNQRRDHTVQTLHTLSQNSDDRFGDTKKKEKRRNVRLTR